jgi:hypothetical protein
MSGNSAKTSLAIAVMIAGVAINPTVTLLVGPSIGQSFSEIDIPLVVEMALPFLASLVALAITRETRLATIAALVPLSSSVLAHVVLLTGANSYPLAVLVLTPFSWINLLLCLPLGYGSGCVVSRIGKTQRRCLTLRWSGSVKDKVPSSCIGVRAVSSTVRQHMRIHLVAATGVLAVLLAACDPGDGSLGHAITVTVQDVGGSCVVGEKHQMPCDAVASYLRDTRHHELNEGIAILVRSGDALGPSSKVAEKLKAAGFVDVTTPTVVVN